VGEGAISNILFVLGSKITDILFVTRFKWWSKPASDQKQMIIDKLLRRNIWDFWIEFGAWKILAFVICPLSIEFTVSTLASVLINKVSFFDTRKYPVVAQC
jgi:hypothetical protein